MKTEASPDCTRIISISPELPGITPDECPWSHLLCGGGYYCSCTRNSRNPYISRRTFCSNMLGNSRT